MLPKESGLRVNIEEGEKDKRNENVPYHPNHKVASISH